MTIHFKPVEPPGSRPQVNSHEPAPVIQVPWLPPAGLLEVAERLFEFLHMLRDGRLHATQPLVMDPTTLQSLYLQPPEPLVQALQHQVDALLAEIGPNPGQWQDFKVSPAILGVTLAAYISLTPNLVPAKEELDMVWQFGAALVESLPPARSLPEMLAYHAILAGMGEALPHLSLRRRALLQQLLNRCSLSAAYHLHVATPAALTTLATQLMPWWKRRAEAVAPWHGPNDWMETVVTLTSQPALALYLRRRWLSLPETRHSCRNLGLLLEALRRMDGQREFILTFYEAYDRLNAKDVPDAWDSHLRRIWPVLAETERLLRAGQDGSEGPQQAAVSLNRRGNEYFLKFYPLLEIIVADGHPPNDFRLLSNEFILALRNLLEWVTLGTVSGLKMGDVSFE